MRGFIIALALCGLSSAAFAQGTITTIHPSAPQQPTAISGPSGYLAKSNNLSDLSNAATARSNLGLSSSSGIDTTNANNITSGTLVAARLPAFAAGDVTSSAGSAVLSIVNGHVTAAKMASGAAVGNIGFTPSNKAGDTFTGNVNLSSGLLSYQINGASVLGLVGGQGQVTQLPVTVNSSGAAAANTTLINAAIQAYGTAGGGTVNLPCGDVYISGTIDNNVPRVLVQGCSRLDTIHDGGANDTHGTRIVPTTTAFTVLKHHTPYSATTVRFSGGGFTNMTVVGGARQLEVDSVGFGTYNLYLLDPQAGTEAAYFTSGRTGTDVAEAADIQHASINLRIRLYGSAVHTMNGVVLDGSTTANFSYNDDVHIMVQHLNGDALVCKNADNNHIWLSAYAVDTYGTSGKTINGYVPDGTGAQGCAGNIFEHVQGAATRAIYLAANAGSGGVTNTIKWLDDGNGTPTPTAGSGSWWTYLRGTILAWGGVNTPVRFESNIAASAVLIGANQALLYEAGAENVTLGLATAGTINTYVGFKTGSGGGPTIYGPGGTLAFAAAGNDVASVAANGFAQLLGGTQLHKVTAATVLAITCNSTIEGMLYAVTDANSAVFNAAIASGGANHVMAFCNGSSWTVH